MTKKKQNLLYNLVRIIVPVFLLFLVLLFANFKPLLTNSASFDAKIEDFENRKIKQIDLLAIGSSMTLNNLSSQVLVDSLRCSYYNLSAWGLQMDDIKNMLQYYIPKLKPKYVLIVSSNVDFMDKGNETIKNYINTPGVLKQFKGYFYYENFNPLPDIIMRWHILNKDKHAKTGYDCLAFDRNGGILLKVPPAQISAERWNLKLPFPTAATNYQYNELDSLATFLKANSVKLFFVQPPIKKLYIASLNSPTALSNHFAKCESIVKRNSGIYINLSGMPEYSTDKLFVDQFHLSAPGATLLTQKMVSIIKSSISINANKIAYQ